MDLPVFPPEFVRDHCPKVLEARHWRGVYGVAGTPEDDVQFAECEFQRAGCGMECENCELHLTRPFLGHKVDKKFLPLIEQYYEDMKVYEEWAKKEAERERQAQMDVGAGI